MKTFMLMTALCVVGGLSCAAFAQGVDAAFGISTVSSPSSATASSNYTTQTVGGGTFLGFSGDLRLKPQIGIGGELNWRASQNLYGGYQPFRPLFWDFNAMWMPRVGKAAQAELVAGVGAESARFYGFQNCSYVTGCTNYVSSNHFMGDVGAGLRLYVHGNMFVRPEARLYMVRNNNEFSSALAGRYGVSLGYSFGGR